MTTVNCKNTFEGVFQFSYEWDVGGGGICDNENSVIVACQEPGSPYVDNEVFTMAFAKCPEVQSSTNKGELSIRRNAAVVLPPWHARLCTQSYPCTRVIVCALWLSVYANLLEQIET